MEVLILSDGMCKKCSDAELNGRVSPADMYKEGSASLRNYSDLTMKVRTLAMHLFLGSAVALAVASSKDVTELPKYAFWGGACLALFSITLLCINWHFATAFNVIRNSMADLEDGAGVQPDGPWQRHQLVRGGWRDPLAYTAPFTALFLLGTSLAFYAWHQMDDEIWEPWISIVIVILLTVLMAVWGMRSTWDKKEKGK